jgi:hypothetical protein
MRQHSKMDFATADTLAPHDIALEVLAHTRRMLRLQRWLFALTLTFAAVGFSFEFSTRGGHLQEAHFMFRDHPAVFGGSLACALLCAVLYIVAKKRGNVIWSH